jgi:hypothetical protein
VDGLTQHVEIGGRLPRVSVQHAKPVSYHRGGYYKIMKLLSILFHRELITKP